MKKKLKLWVDKANPLDLQVMLKIMDILEENRKFRKAIEKIHNDIGVCGNDSIGKWGIEEYCNGVLNDNNFSA